MESTITKKVKGLIMENLFDNPDLINIRYFKNKTLKLEEDFNKEYEYTYEIKIRHNSKENPKNLLDEAIKKLTH